MKSFKLSLLFLLVISGLITNAQTADEIINKHIEAIGGKDKISNIKTVQIESVMTVMGNEAPMTTTILNGKGYRNEIDFNGTKIVQVVTDKGGWMINPMMGASDPTAMPDEQFKGSRAQIVVGGPLMDYASRGYTVEIKGKEKVGTVDAYKIIMTTPDKLSTTFYFDPTTYYILKAVSIVNMNGQEAETTSTFSDYRKTDAGYILPYSSEITSSMGFSMTANVKKVDVNKDVDPKIFDMPKQ